MHSGALGEPLDADLEIAAPCDMGGPQLAASEAEPVGADRGQVGSVVSATAPAHLSQMRSVPQGAALRVPLAGPAAGVV